MGVWVYLLAEEAKRTHPNPSGPALAQPIRWGTQTRSAPFSEANSEIGEQGGFDMDWRLAAAALLCGLCAVQVDAKPRAIPAKTSLRHFDLAKLPGSRPSGAAQGHERWGLSDVPPSYGVQPQPRVKWTGKRIKVRVPFSTSSLIRLAGLTD